jgi:hypothetical protein
VTLATSQLTAAETRDALTQIITWLRVWEQTDLEVMFGVGYRDHEMAWVPFAIRIDELDEFVRRNEANELFTYGSVDLLVSFGSEKKDYFRLCHESDIHLSSQNPSILNAVKSQWIAKGWAVYERE